MMFRQHNFHGYLLLSTLFVCASMGSTTTDGENTKVNLGGNESGFCYFQKKIKKEIKNLKFKNSKFKKLYSMHQQNVCPYFSPGSGVFLGESK